MSEMPESVEARIEAVREKAGDCLDRCQFQSAYNLYGEIRRLAKAENRLIDYMLGIFHQMDLSLDLIQPARGRDFAVELIALLESEDRARHVQPDLPEGAYEHTRSWMSACAYENLAEAVGRLEGYNSEGMHNCITDGIQVCRRTGKLACVRCFREYATEVYTAADDVPLALHHARTIATFPGPWSNRGNRQWYGSKNEGWLLLLMGDAKKAEAALKRALEQVGDKEVSLPLQARLRTAVESEQFGLVAGQVDPTKMTVEAGNPFRLEVLADDEYPANRLRWRFNDALAATCRGDHESAIGQLVELDRWLSDRKNLHESFEAQLRLIAAHRLAGKSDKLSALAGKLGARAEKARDWLTLRRLARLMAPEEAPSPLALLGPLRVGPFAATTTVAVPGREGEAPAESREGEAPAEPEEKSSAGASPSPGSAPQKTPLDDVIQGLIQRLDQIQSDEDCLAVLDDVLAIPPDQAAAHLPDAGRLIRVLTFVTREGGRAAEAWAWAEKAVKLFPQHAGLINALATLGDVIRGGSEAGKEAVSEEQVVRLYRQSLDLDPFDPLNHLRAGNHYLDVENLGESERCLARGFRLQRDNGHLAMRLAEVYRQTERPRDALAVLDMCLREGCEDPQVSWEAAMLANQVGQHDALLTYLDSFEAREPGQPWTSYYRAIGRLETGQPEQALADLAEEARRNPEAPFPAICLRACALAALDRTDDFVAALGEALAIPLSRVAYLTLTGLTNLFERLAKATQRLPEDHPARQELEQLALASGLASDDYFEAHRQRGEEVPDVHFYRCLAIQPLDENWPQSPGCLPGQEGWDAYAGLWGALARDEDEAKRLVQEWQGRCHPLPADMVQIDEEDGTFKDRVGVVWQGERNGLVSKDENEEEAEE